MAFAAGVLALWPVASRAQASGHTAQLERFYDPVIVQTGRLFGPSDRRVSHYRLYALRDGRLAPIPYQFDARDAHDALLVGQATPGSERFDSNDELVFMARDAGDRLVDPSPPAGADALLEIEIVDPRDGARAWAYLAHVAGSVPARSSERYVTFDRASNGVRSALYSGTYVQGTNNFATFRVLPAAGGSGENLFRRVRVVVQPTFSLLIGSFSPLFTESRFSVRIDGIKNGPVRAIRRVRQWLDLGRFFPKAPSGTTYTLFYEGFFETPSVFKIPWLPLQALREFRFIGVTDFSAAGRDMVYWDPANPRGLPLSDLHTPVVRDRDHEWYVVSGRGGTLMHVFEIPKAWLDWGVIRGTRLERPGATSSATPRLLAPGYSLLHIPDIQKAGSYAMKMQFFVLRRRYRPGDELAPLARIRDPLETQVRWLPESAAASPGG